MDERMTIIADEIDSLEPGHTVEFDNGIMVKRLSEYESETYEVNGDGRYDFYTTYQKAIAH